MSNVKWEQVKLKEVCKCYQPATISTKQMIINGEFNVYGANGIIGKYNKYNHIECEVLLTCRGATCGKVNISKPFSWINGNAMVLHPLDPKQLDQNFLAYYFIFKGQDKSLITGTAQPQIVQNKLNEFPIPLPPLPEQHRIVAKIDALFSCLDKGVEMLHTIQQQLRTYRQAVLKWAFEGKLTNDVIEEFGRLQDLCFFITKGTTPKKTDMTADLGDVPFIKVYNLTFSGTLDFSIDPTFISFETHNGFLARSKVIHGDVLMNIVGPPLGKVSIAPDTHKEFNINQAIARFRCNDRLYNKFLAYYLLFNGTIETISKKSKATAGQFNLTLEICRDIEIPLLDINKQSKIVAEIESRLSICDKLEAIVEENLNKAQALKQSILKKAFSGQLVPQDPNDEPAEKLLECIKAERHPKTVKTKAATCSEASRARKSKRG